MELSTGKILEEILEESIFQLAFLQTLEDEITFQQDNLNHKAKSTLMLLTKKTVNVPGWMSYLF
jgi:hypothetical protein